MPYPLAHYAFAFVLLVTVVAFWPSYFGQLGEAPVAFHVHGVSATLWLVLAGFQSWTIHHRRRHLHRTVGLASLGLFPVLVASLVMIANVSAQAHASADPYGRQVGAVFVWATAAALIAYLWLFREALRNRRRVHLHAGYMLATIFFLWEPAASRLLVGFFPPMAVGGPEDFHKIPHAIALGSAMAIPVALYLYVRRDRGRAPLLATILLLLLQIGGIYTVAVTDLWRGGVEAYAGLPAWLTVGTGFLLGVLAAWSGWVGSPAERVTRRVTPKRSRTPVLIAMAAAFGGAVALPGGLAGLQDSLVVQAPAPTADDVAIYGLAVDSTRWSDSDVVLLLDERILHVDESGTHRYTTRSVRQARTQEMARRLAEIGLQFDGGREAMHLDWARVVDPDGAVLSGSVHAQLMDVPVGGAAPIYSDAKQIRASLGGAEAGRIFDVAFTREMRDPAIPADWLQSFTFNGTTPVRRARLVIDTPEGMTPRIVEENLPSPATVRTESGRTIREWLFEDIEPVEPELFPADTGGVRMQVSSSGPLEWADVGRWYADLLDGRMAVSSELAERFSEVVAGAGTRTDSLRALHRWVAQDIRYVSLSLGLGGYQPRLPAEVVESGLGDCKDKAILFIALARHMGVEAYPVLARTSGSIRSDLPSPRNFNHMVVALRDGGEWVYVDLTVPTAPWGAVVPPLQGQQGLMIRPDGEAEIVDFPLDPASENRSSIVVTGTLDADGTLTAEYEEIVTGTLQYRLRGEFDERLDERARLSLRQNLANRVGRGGVADSVEFFDGLDLEATPRLWASVTVEDLLQEIPGGWLLPVGLSTYGNPALVERLESEGDRSFPIDAAKVFGLREHHSEYRITLPEGWQADLPDDVVVEGPFGEYRSIYEQTGRELLVTRTIRGTDTILPPEDAPELLEWFRPLADDRVQTIVIRGPDAGE